MKTEGRPADIASDIVVTTEQMDDTKRQVIFIRLCPDRWQRIQQMSM